MPFITPPSASPLVKAEITIPEDFIPQFEGAILELTYDYNWEQRDGITPEECQRAMIDAMQTITYSEL